LKYRIGRATLDVVRIEFRCSASPLPKSPPAAPASQLEQSLLQTGRADVYSIYFSFNSDRIREESEPTLDEIADVLRRHPDWKLAIEGHTDSIANDAYNLALSQRRAAAVKQALVSRKSVAGARLTTTGVGESRPKDRNDTLEGRARNRRVELVRVP
jgi:outer membrane protein OmpA-like peptidoglycan-associated protein